MRSLPLEFSSAPGVNRIDVEDLIRDRPKPRKPGWEPFASTLLHALIIAAALFLSGWQVPTKPPPPPEPVVPITLQPMPEFRPEPVPAPSPARPSIPSPRETVRPKPSETHPKVEVPPPRPVTPALPKQEKPPGDPSAPRRDTATPPSGSETPGGAEGRPGGLDLQSALREFGRNLRVTEPGPGEDGGGKGKGAGRATGDGRGLNAPELTALPSSGFGFGNLEFESKDYDWTDYARQIYVAIWRAWHNRLYLTTDAFEKWSFRNQVSMLEHQNRIRFTIQRNGEVVGIALESPSGCEPLDDSALNALKEVVLPPIPSDFPRDQETIHAQFLATGEIRYMRPSLQYLRDRGYF